MWQAYCDGSGTGDPNIMVIAGYVASAETWGSFSTAWKAQLIEANLERFKMHEMASKPEFAAWFYRLIEGHDIKAAISCVIRTSDLVKIVETFDWPENLTPQDIRRLKNPYYLGFRATVEMMARHQKQLGFYEPVDFIFDDQSEAGPITEAWDWMQLAAPLYLRKMFGDRPSFKRDDCVMPLQAADLYAWWVLKWARLGDANAGVKDFQFDWDAKRSINRLHYEYNESELRAGLEGAVKRANTLAQFADPKAALREGWARFDFEFSIRHVSFTQEFYGSSPVLKLDESVWADYSKAPDTARIFIQRRDGEAFSAAELLTWYLKKENKGLDDYVPAQEAALSLEGQRQFSLFFPINFTPNSFCMRTKSGLTDLKSLALTVEFTLAPKNHS